MTPLEALVVPVPDFPEPGITFRDITPLLGDPDAFAHATTRMAAFLAQQAVTAIAGIESRGFVFGAAVARELGLPLHLVRKPGRLPRRTLRVDYELEYGTDAIEIHVDDVPRGARFGLVDDVLATGGTAAAGASALTRTGAEVVAAVFLLELADLAGRDRVPCPTHSLLSLG